ncbi:ATP-dependent helicase [Hoyosella altamirensis]|uniref:DNA 3'-5' helicase n=1 Tax=Hoyosella altamirensis TaxID=616997 RepID=A0A839RHS9_9ACTN|nr:UvrD-helicase domain-containing protein [Hoyosella altamirensis]MBB3035683.1 DNA helicase-2/ATP-dependent DNA helicase PcrA [Hoyosella altamirensis]
MSTNSVRSGRRRKSSGADFSRPRFTPSQLAQSLGQPLPTPEQQAVITAPAGPLLVVAGAGAGKTETMATRVVWLVANDFVHPEKVLGLTFTRKAAHQLTTRIRSRLARLAGTQLLHSADPSGELRARLSMSEPEVSTYHAYAGKLLAEHALRLPIEPSATLLSETQLWQIAHRVVSTWDGELDLERTPASVTSAVLALSAALDEHMIDIDDLSSAHLELEKLVYYLPPGPRQRQEPNQRLLSLLATQHQRLQLLPLVQQLRSVLREEGALDYGSQMSLAARLAANHPEAGQGERERYRAVLLDEYQDTGHAQRILLAGLFGNGSDPALAVTAVGDPIQSIYGWRGASAANLPRFAMDFPCGDGSPAPRLELLTSWRNPVTALSIANKVSEPLRSRGVPVSTLKPRPDAAEGEVQLALCGDVAAERRWVAQQMLLEYDAARERGEPPPTAAVLVRRNRDAAPLAEAMHELGIPVEVVGLGGLLETPEVQDLVAMLRLIADPMAGTAAVRVLTGARWRLGAADLASLWRRARELAIASGQNQSAVSTREELDNALDDAIPGEVAEQPGISDALADPGAADRYSSAGFARITELGRELAALRERLGQPLTELVADVERTVALGIETEARGFFLAENALGAGREHLDAFADVVAGYARHPAASLTGLLAFLDAAAVIENGLAPGETQVAPDRVQILTVHSAKGLEWEVVAIPHLVEGVFPSSTSAETWLTSIGQIPSALRGDRQEGPDGEGSDGVPVLKLENLNDRKQLEETITRHQDAFKARGLDEERRLLYVALTRTERVLCISGHQWGETGDKPKGPSLFLEELRDLGESGGISICEWAQTPGPGDENPLTTTTRIAQWPIDPLGQRRADIEAGASLVFTALKRLNSSSAHEDDDQAETSDGAAWAADVDVLLAERERRRTSEVLVEMPQHLSVSNLVALASDPAELALRLRRPLPFPPNPLARRGTAFHAWLERRYGATRLLDLDELPGAADTGASPDADLEQLQEAFLASEWALRSPAEVEVPFETTIGGTVLRGRIDAVFRDDDGGYSVVDWKTGAEPGPCDRTAVSMQLAAYRIAWADLMTARGTPVSLEKVRAAFHYVRSGRTIAPQDLPDKDGLRTLLANPGDTHHTDGAGSSEQTRGD